MAFWHFGGVAVMAAPLLLAFMAVIFWHGRKIAFPRRGRLTLPSL